MAYVRTSRIIDEAGVDVVLDTAEQHALERGHRVVIAVVERSGELVGLRRTPGAQIASASPSTRRERRRSSCGRAGRSSSRSAAVG
jgi:uncharacterized protein GlcG (DUF336 family)